MSEEKLTMSERLEKIKKLKESKASQDEEHPVQEKVVVEKVTEPVKQSPVVEVKETVSPTLEVRKMKVFANFKGGIIRKTRSDNVGNVYEHPIHDSYIKLSMNHNYQFSVTPDANFDDPQWSTIKLAKQWRGKLEVTDVGDGLATVFVRYNDIRINDGDLLCELV
jgi:hypothetical protein